MSSTRAHRGQIDRLCRDEKQFMLRYGRNCSKRLYFGDVGQFIVNYGRLFVDVEWRPVAVGRSQGELGELGKLMS